MLVPMHVIVIVNVIPPVNVILLVHLNVPVIVIPPVIVLLHWSRHRLCRLQGHHPLQLLPAHLPLTPCA